jgi:hypothetical protein
MQVLKVSLGVAALASAIGCSGSDPAPGTGICSEPAIPSEQLLYPIPGATGVPTAAGSVVFAGSLDAASRVVLTAGGVEKQLGTLVVPPSPLPSPMATPAIAGSPLSSAPYPALASATTYTVSITFDFGSAACPAPVLTEGSFTTQ